MNGHAQAKAAEPLFNPLSPDFIRDPYPMERQSIADYLGMTFETVCRVLSRLQEERILSLTEPRHRGIVLHDRSKLAQRDGRRIVSPKPSGS